jgi:lysyl endopeptidase
MPGFQAPDKRISKENILLKAARGQAPLVKLYGNLNAESAKVKRLPSLDFRENSKQKLEKLLRIGVVRQLAVPLDPISDSALYRIAEGDVRVAAIVSPGSLRTRLHFQSMSLPTGARVFVYSMSEPDEFYGPYEGHGASDDGTFWTPPLTGEGVVIEYFTPAGSTSADMPFRISEVSHNYKDVLRSTDSAGACNLEVPPEWGNVAKSVGLLDFITGGFEALCTGTLLSDSDLNSDHQVLTANHCISSQSEAQSVTVYWNYNSGESPSPNNGSTIGSSLLVTGTASDFTLLRLTGSLPPGLFFSGWDASQVSASTPITGIHHPQGSHKRISFGATNSDCAAGLPGPCSNFTGVTWSQGTTEPGSSGSGLWTGTSANAMLVGTLTGGFASCSSPTGSDFYGRFSVTYPNIVGFLTTSCVSGINPTSQSFSASGGTGSIMVTAPAACSWTASSTDAFLTITSGSSGTGPGTISFSVAGNNGLQRSGSIVVGRQVFNVNQAAGGVCAPTPISVGQTINGTLTTSDCPLGDGSYVDAYSFDGTAGQRISILMTSSSFDTVLYLLNPDGSVLKIDDDGGGGPNGTDSRIPAGSGFFTLPGSGSYTILANSFDAGATGPYSLTFNALIPRTLTVASSNPGSGVGIVVRPSDNTGLSDGTTQFIRTYDNNTSVSLAAPGTAGGNNFQKWQRDDGVVVTTDLAANVVMDANHTMTAVYVPPVTFVLTVASSNPSSGVSVTVTPNDNSGLGNGATQFTRTYNQNATVNVSAPARAGGSTFWKWQLNGVDYAQSQFATITMNANLTATAIYVSPPPTPTPTPVPGAGSQRIAFARQVSSPGNTGADIFLTNVDGTGTVNLTNAQGDDSLPAWSLDGKRLAYTCRTQPDGSTNGPQRICIRNADGTGFTVLSQTLAEDFGPAWSRDGSQIAFTTFNPGFQSTVYIINADGTGRRPLNLDLLGARNPDWSPDGQSIVVDYLNSIWVSRAYSYGYLRLTNATSDSNPRYSPDGSKIVFQSTRDGQAEIYVMNSNGTGQMRLTNDPASDTAPAWSPDGTKILFTSSRDDPMNPALYIMNADGSNPTRVTYGNSGVWRGASTVQFSSSSYTVNEGDPSGHVNITLTRAGDTTNSASVSFATNDAAGLTNCNVINGIASPRCDYENTIGTAIWAAGDASPKTFSVAIVDDSYAEGTETFTISLNSPSGATLGAQSTATVIIVDNDATNGPNPIDSTNFFVRQQYIDFLGREPDPPGLAGWTSTINNCSGDTTQCDRIHVSQLFFQSAEFQQRGYFVYRFYPVAFGRKPDYSEFVPDLASVSGFLDANQLEAAKVAFIAGFTARPAFVSAYNGLTNQQYVDMLLNTAGVTMSSRQAMIDSLSNSTMTRGQVLRQIVESPEVSTKYNHQAYAVMEYFGYLRRQPDGFYLQWIAVLDQSNDPRGMVTGFVTSQEYRNRFGP